MKDLNDRTQELQRSTNRVVEQIQTAAVAVANIEVEMYGESHANALVDEFGQVRQVDEVLELVRGERVRQDELWGTQSGPPKERFAILMEEVGEIAEEISIPGPMDTRRPEDYIVEGAQELGRKAKAWLEQDEAA